MKKTLLTLFCCAAFGLVYSQSCGNGGSAGSIGGSAGSISSSISSYSLRGFSSDLGRAMGVKNTRNYLLAIKNYDDIQGSPFLTKDAVTATLVMNNDGLIENVLVKIDIFANEIIATNDEGVDIVLDTRFYKEVFFTFNGELLSLKKVNPKHPNVFYEVLYESGNIAFFKEQKAKLREGKNIGITQSISRFNQHKKYFVSGEDGAVVKVNLKKRDVFDHFPELEAVAFREYIKSAKIKLKMEKDYKQLFAAMDDD
ncbi:MAG: hypothetical protein V3V00_13545 [Saprospiraceae bacterium]